MDVTIICYAKCWPCQFGEHYHPPQRHTWMGAEDATAAGLSWPMTAEQEAAHPCACRCGGGPGGCQFIPGAAS